MSEEQLWYYIDKDEAQQGPITIPQLQELVAAATVTHDTIVWTEALGDQWIPACNVEGLFENAVPGVDPPAPMTETASVPLAAPPTTPPAPTAMAQAGGNPLVRSAAQPAVVSTPQQPGLAPTTPMIPSTPTTQPVAAAVAGVPAAAGLGAATAPAAGADPFSSPQTNATLEANDYPHPMVGKSNAILYIIFKLAAVALFCFAAFSAYNLVLKFSEGADMTGEEVFIKLASIGLISLIGLALLLTAFIFLSIYTFKAWKCLVPGGSKASPIMNALLIWIPGINIIWSFMAWAKLPNAWNSITSNYHNTSTAPKLSKGLFIIFAIVSAYGFLVMALNQAQESMELGALEPLVNGYPIIIYHVLNLVLGILCVKQMVNGINFMAKIGQGAPATGGALGGALGAAPAQAGGAGGALGGFGTPAAAPAAAPSAFSASAPMEQPAVGAPVEQAHPGMLDMSAVNAVDAIPAGTAPVAIKAPNPLLGANAPAQPAPNPLLGVHGAEKPNPLLPNGAIKPVNKLNTAVPPQDQG